MSRGRGVKSFNFFKKFRFFSFFLFFGIFPEIFPQNLKSLLMKILKYGIMFLFWEYIPDIYRETILEIMQNKWKI